MSRGDIRLRAPDSDAYNQIAARLRERRLQLGLTQDAVCARLSEVTGRRWIADRIDILKLEKATRTVTDLEALALAVALECAPAWLMFGDESSEARGAALADAWRASPATDEERRPRRARKAANEPSEAAETA